MLGYRKLAMVDIEGIREGAKCIIHADGEGDEPHCLAILIPGPEVAHLYDGNNARRIIVSSLRDILPDSR